MVTIFRIVSIDLDSSCKDTVDPYDGRKGKTLYQNINIWYSFPSKDHYVQGYRNFLIMSMFISTTVFILDGCSFYDVK